MSQGHSRRANAVFRVALPPLAPADPAPAGASPDGLEARFITSLFLRQKTSRGHSGRANAVSRVASPRKTFHLKLEDKAYFSSPGCSVTLASGAFLADKRPLPRA